MTPGITFPAALGFIEDPADKVSRRQDSVNVTFSVTMERYDREKFQRDGHFVNRVIDSHGRPRDWEGPLVFVAILYYEMRDGMGTLQDRSQILRVLADTQAEAGRLMGERIRETFFAQYLASRIQTDTAMQLKRLNEENAILRAKCGELK